MARSKVFPTLLFALLAVAPSSSSPSPVVVASSRFYFPHLVSGNDAETTFVVSNSGVQDADVVFTAYDDSGYLIGEGFNPTTVTIAGQSQTHINFGALFKIPGDKMVTGWVKAESVNLQLSAWMLMSLNGIPGDTLDALVVSDQAAKRMVFSAIFQGADIVTGIGLANPDTEAARVKASLYSEGRLAEIREFQIPAYGHRAWLLHELFESNVTVGHVEIDSDVGIVGFQEFSQPHQWSAVPMQLLEETSELVFPLPPLGKNLWAGIALANVGDFDLDFTLTAWGTGLDPVAGPVKRVVKPHGELMTLVSDLFSNLPSAGGFISVKADIGPARMFGARPALSGLAVVGRDDLRALASFSLTEAASRGLVEVAKDKKPGNLVLMSGGLPLASLQIESSEQGFFIIPGHDQTATINADKDKDKDKGKDKDKDKDKDDKDKDKDKDKCKDKHKDKEKGKDKDKCKAEAVNQAPFVNAGPDQIITVPNSATLRGTSSDDGLPGGTTLTTTWSKVSGPGTVTFGNAHALRTAASFSGPGLYVLRLTASDGALSSTDEIAIIANQAPAVNAGPDQTIRLPNSATLNGTASDDGLPSGGTPTTKWSKVSGPGTVTFGNAHALSTTASFSAHGLYVLRLTASDAVASSTDEVAITVNAPLSIRVAGNNLVNGNGQIVRLLGVNRPGTEYSCVLHDTIFDGPTDAASVQAMASWNINTVRIPLNEHCWLGINGANPASSGSIYQNAIVHYVNLLHQFNLYAILDLHWSGPGATLARGQQVMANQDHSPAFWTSVATTFKNDPAVLFDLYNEPNMITDSCWRDGCTTPDGWQAVGTQSLVNTVRATGATQPILISGNRHGNDLSGWLNFKPHDPLLSLVASAHTYNFNDCVSESCWNSNFRPVAAVVPFVSAEIGENDCAHGFIDTYMSWLDSVGAGYLGWGWVTASCETQPSLILDYSGTPTNYGIGLRNRLLNLTTHPALNSLTLQ